MEGILNLYGNFVLLVSGFFISVLSISLSVFEEGITLLSARYQEEEKQVASNLRLQLTAKEEKAKFDLAAIETTIKTLKSDQRKLLRGLAYLSPKDMLTSNAAWFSVSFSLLLVSLTLQLAGSPILSYLATILVFSSFSAFLRGIYVFSISISILIDASREVQRKDRSDKERTIELLSAILDTNKANATPRIYVNPEQVELQLREETVAPDKEYDFSINKPYDVSVILKNKDDLGIRRAEIGIVFPSDVLVEESPRVSVFSSTKEKIVRFNIEFIHSHENLHLGAFKITFLKSGIHYVRCFSKGENMYEKSIKFKVKVVE